MRFNPWLLVVMSLGCGQHTIKEPKEGSASVCSLDGSWSGVQDDKKWIYCYLFLNVRKKWNSFSRASSYCHSLFDAARGQRGGMLALVTDEELHLVTLLASRLSGGVTAVILGLHRPAYIHRAISGRVLQSEPLNLYVWQDLELYTLAYWNMTLSGDFDDLIKERFIGGTTDADPSPEPEEWCTYLEVVGGAIRTMPCRRLFKMAESNSTIKLACRGYKLHNSCGHNSVTWTEYCANTFSGYTHLCKPGYHVYRPKDGSGASCSDVNECSREGQCTTGDDCDKCFHGGTCRNIPGSFVCECGIGFKGEQCEIGVLRDPGLKAWHYVLIILAVTVSVVLLVFTFICVKTRMSSPQPPPSSYQASPVPETHLPTNEPVSSTAQRVKQVPQTTHVQRLTPVWAWSGADRRPSVDVRPRTDGRYSTDWRPSLNIRPCASPTLNGMEFGTVPAIICREPHDSGSHLSTLRRSITFIMPYSPGEAIRANMLPPQWKSIPPPTQGKSRILSMVPGTVVDTRVGGSASRTGVESVAVAQSPAVRSPMLRSAEMESPDKVASEAVATTADNIPMMFRIGGLSSMGSTSARPSVARPLWRISSEDSLESF